MTHLPRYHEPHSSIKPTRIPKYNAKRSFLLACASTRLNLYFFSSFEIQSRFSVQNVFRQDFTLLPCDLEPHSSIKSTRNTFHAITSPIQALNPLGFPNPTRSDQFDSLVQEHV
ncbi:uncharacterized protein G2W53_004329 [Senna tora]|uniref:Uncharacterized protein n=1 Tax=Senna tora TaxID=362788 RepID=A0A834XD51_9FABA|nr:uncharacterized protein G2W53_004329 [Senna tora]